MKIARIACFMHVRHRSVDVVSTHGQVAWVCTGDIFLGMRKCREMSLVDRFQAHCRAGKWRNFVRHLEMSRGFVCTHKRCLQCVLVLRSAQSCVHECKCRCTLNSRPIGQLLCTVGQANCVGLP